MRRTTISTRTDTLFPDTTLFRSLFGAGRRQLKRGLLCDIAARVRRQLCRNGVPETIIARATRYVDDCNSKALVLGFARRFATYKRATLILRDEARLARLLNDPARPAILIFSSEERR